MSRFEPLRRLTRTQGEAFMKRTLGIVVAIATAAAVFAGLVHAVLVVGHVSEPAVTTVYGLTLRRLWATTAAGLALLGLIAGGISLARPVSRLASGSAPFEAIIAIAAGVVAALNGALNVAVATGGPGTGNGVVGGAAALVLGLAAAGTGWIALARSRRNLPEPRPLT